MRPRKNGVTVAMLDKALNDLGWQMVALVKMGFNYPAEFVRGPRTFGTRTR